ncbi:MAG: BrnA antitoxin family protein [Pseudomonadota bacterium]
MKKKNSAPTNSLTNAEWESMGKVMYGIEGLPESARAAVLNLRGRPKAKSKKISLSLRLDEKVYTFLKSSGKGWQTRINSYLLSAIEHGQI